MRGWLGLVACAALLAGTQKMAAATTALDDCRTQVPVPPDSRIVPPTPGTPDDIARFSGVWTGAWFDRKRKLALCVGLVVERVHDNGLAEVIYSHGTHRPWDLPLPGHFRAVARVRDGTLAFPTPSGSVFAFTPREDGGLSATRNGRGRARLVRLDGLTAMGCPAPADVASAAPPGAAARKRITAAELLSTDPAPAMPVHNAYFAPLGEVRPATRGFEGRITIEAHDIPRFQYGCPGEPLASPEWVLDFVTDGDRLVPRVRGLMVPGDGDSMMRMIVSPGRVWREPADDGWSRAAFPFVWTTTDVNDAHNGLATFLFNARTVSALRLQIVQETEPGRPWTAAAQISLRYRAGPVPDGDRIRARFAQERRAAWPIRPLSDLAQAVPPALLADFAGTWAGDDVSAGGLVLERQIHALPCRTRFGDFPYCRHMRHAAYSVTKSMGAALTLLRLAQKYGAGVLDLKVIDYIDVPARGNGWDQVTFADALNMTVGVGSRAGRKRAGRWRQAGSRDARLALALTAPDDPWGPGERMRYDGLHTFTLTAAMEAFYRQRQGPQADLWDMMREEVLEPIGVFHAPLRRTTEADGRRGTPIFAYGLYPTLEETAKIAGLLQNGGGHDGRQLLYAPGVRDALYRSDAMGVATGRDNRYGRQRYHLSFWSTPYIARGGCALQLPYMAGYGGNIVLLLPNGVTAIRFTDSFNGEQAQMIHAASALRPLCPAAPRSPAAAMKHGEPLTAEDLRQRLVGNTLRAKDWRLYLRPDGTASGGSGQRDVLGTWRIADGGTLCTRYAVMRGGIENCYDVIEQKHGLVLRAVDRFWTAEVSVAPGNPDGY